MTTRFEHLHLSRGTPTYLGDLDLGQGGDPLPACRYHAQTPPEDPRGQRDTAKEDIPDGFLMEQGPCTRMILFTTFPYLHEEAGVEEQCSQDHHAEGAGKHRVLQPFDNLPRYSR